MKREHIHDVLWALGKTFAAHATELIIGPLLSSIQTSVVTRIVPIPNKGASRLITARLLMRTTIDGAVIEGPVQKAYAKFSFRKGMPKEGQKFMGVEGNPHQVNDFSGVIKEGYGKGKKELVWAGDVPIKIGDKTFVGRVNIHRHWADKAGLHTDFSAEGVPPRAPQFETNIPFGEFKRRYAFLRPEGFAPGEVLAVAMKDYGLSIPKPTFHLKHRDMLVELDKDRSNTIVEWKPDGSLANILIKDYRAVFTSHRPQAASYYDKLPAIEWLKNNSRLFTNRWFFPGPDQEGTVLKGELFHPEGAARVGGILNSAAAKSQVYQHKHGPVIVFIWDLVKLRGKNVGNLPYIQRRKLYEGVVTDIRRFNTNWHTVPSAKGSFVAFYDRITNDPRGLPFSEGVVIKRANDPSGEPWDKVKVRDTTDFTIVDVIEGIGKRKDSVGRIVVKGPTGGLGEIGSFAMPDWMLKKMWEDRKIIKGEIIEAMVQDITASGAPRAGVMTRFHPSKSDYSLELEAEAIAGVDGRSAKSVKYAIKSAAGWRRK